VHGELFAGDQSIWLHPSGEGYRYPRELGGVSSMIVVGAEDADAHYAYAEQRGPTFSKSRPIGPMACANTARATSKASLVLQQPTRLSLIELVARTRTSCGQRVGAAWTDMLGGATVVEAGRRPRHPMRLAGGRTPADNGTGRPAARVRRIGSPAGDPGLERHLPRLIGWSLRRVGGNARGRRTAPRPAKCRRAAGGCARRLAGCVRGCPGGRLGRWC
jgi:hypothetical protein